MAALISSICCTLIILAFCQIIVETMLPEGSTKRYVVFITGLVGVTAIVTILTASGADLMKSIWARTADLKDISRSQKTESSAGMQTNPYQEYIEKLIESYK